MRSRRSRHGVVFGAMSLRLLWACVPTVEEDPSLTVDGQILAVQFFPAEAEPEASSTVSALVAGDADGDDVTFDLCLARKALSELGPVSPLCFERGENVVRLGRGPAVAFDVPEEACRLFGPQRPPAEPGQPPGRAVDPDSTGGYYQPVVARLDDPVLGGLRLDCGLPGGSQAQVAEYNNTHTANLNPAIESIQVRVGDAGWRALSTDGASQFTVERGAQVTFRSKWSPPENYLLLSPESRELTTPKEQYLATFYSSVGGFAEHRRLVEKHTVDAVWSAPETAEDVRIWLIVRDGRGGVGWVRLEAVVE